MSAAPISADLILHNGQVLCMDPEARRARAVAVKNGRIVAIGGDELAELAGEGTRVIDLAGRTLMPGFVEGHIHSEWYGRHQLTVNFKDCKTKEEVIAMLKAAVDATPPGRWVAGCAIPISIMKPGDASFTLADFDEVSPDHPVAVDCASTGHCMWLNTRAMELMGVKESSFPKEVWDGDGMVRDGCGCLTGQLEGHAWNWALRAVKPYTFDWFLEALELAQRDLLKVGITTAHNAWEDPYIFRGWRTLEQQGRLKMRHYITFDIERYGDQLTSAGLCTGFGSDRLKVHQLKVILNVPPRAAMIDDYKTMPGNKGYHLYPPEWVREKVLKAVQDGWSVCAHSTGDRDTEMLLDAFENALDWYKAETGNDNRTLRLRLEHTMFVNPELIERIERNHIIINVRPCGRLSPGDAPGGPHQKLLGEERWRHSRPIKPFVDRGMRINFGCDYPAPCGFLDPAASIFSACGGIGEPWDVVDRYSALKGYTLDSAYGIMAENEIGSIELGKRADLVVWSEDPLTLPLERMWDMKTNRPVDFRADYTIVDGDVVYARD